MFRLQYLASIFAAILLISANPIFAKTVYVNKSFSAKGMGAKSFPFSKISYALSSLKAGDTCLIYGGVYNEILKPLHNGNQDNPIVFMAVPGEEVTISAMEQLNVSGDQDGVVTFGVDFDLGTENLVLCDGEPLTQARWPNKTNDNLLDPEAADIVPEGSSPTEIINHDLPSIFTSQNLKGSTLWANAECKWSCWTSRVVGYNPQVKRIKLKGFGNSWWINERHNPGRIHKHYGAGEFYIAGAEILMDAPGEWYFNKSQKKLSLILPEGKITRKSVIEMKKRKWTVDLTNRSYIQIRGINLVGAPVTFKGAKNCVIKNGEIKHFSYSFGVNSTQGIGNNTGILLAGQNNSIQSCDIYGSAGNGILLSGINNSVFNCDIHNVNFLGSHNGAPVKLEGKGHFISHNTIHQTGRVCISMGGGGHVIQYNHIYNPGRISEDLGVLKCGGTDADNLMIHHNVIHNDNGKFIGIYFDNYSNNIIAHHNIVSGMKDGIRSNRPGHFHILYNNTVSPDINNKFGPWNGPFDQIGSVIVNNLSEKPVMAKPEVITGQNQEFNKDNLSNEHEGEKLTPQSSFEDFPDYAGAVKSGVKRFHVGHDFNHPPEFKLERKLPFIRNHVKNGCFDYSKTYAHASPAYKKKLALEYWVKTKSKEAEVKYFPGFNFPTNPEDRFSIHGNSLCLSGSNEDGVVQEIETLRPNRSYTLSAYVKMKGDAEVLFSIAQKGKTVAVISTNDIELSENSNWKVVKLDFKLGKKKRNVELSIKKSGDGQAYIDDVGIIPIPLSNEN